MAATSNAKAPPESSYVAGIARYRETASRILTIMGAGAGVLAAGLQLTSLGSLDFDNPARLSSAIVGLAGAVLASMGIVYQALRVLRPLPVSLAEALGHRVPHSRENPSSDSATDLVDPAIQRIDWLRARYGSRSVERLELQLRKDRSFWRTRQDQLAEIEAEAAEVLSMIAYERLGRIWADAVSRIGWFAVLAVISLALFAWGANPPEQEPAGGTKVASTPQLVVVDLTTDGREVLEASLGKACASKPVQGLVVGGSAEEPKIVVPDAGECGAAQFTLPVAWGRARSAEPELVVAP